MKFCFATLGCKVNQFETQALSQLAQSRGHILVQSGADVCILNTCTVTSSGDHKNLRALHKLQKENLCLQESRDRLLPKLMSGEIEV